MSNAYRDDNCIEHMIDASRKIIRLADVSRTDYDASEEKQLALERLFEIVGEAASKVSDAFKSTHPTLPWRQASSMRNFVIHDYAGVCLTPTFHFSPLFTGIFRREEGSAVRRKNDTKAKAGDSRRRHKRARG